MPNFLIIGNLHPKNRIGITKILNYLQLEFKFGTNKDIDNYDIIYSPGNSINTALYPKKKFIFGPHFSVFPNNKIYKINNIHKNSIYIQPSQWAADVWINFGVRKFIEVVPIAFPVEIDRFKPRVSIKKDKVFIYFKRRKPQELNAIINFLNHKNINYRIFDYVKRYNEEDYLNYLQQSKYGIILDAHESQGFAIEEALSCNVPLLVWNVSSMSQEEGGNYQHIPATSIPYWDKRCGENFYQPSEFMNKYEEFINKLDTYKPREFVLENLSTQECAENFKKLISEI